MVNPIYYASDSIPVVAAIDPDLVDDASATSDWVDMGVHHQVMFILNVGVTDIAVNAKIQSADDGSGTNAADITDLELTEIPASTGDDKQYIISVKADQLNAGDTHAALVVTVGDGTAGAYISAVGLGIGSNYLPAADVDLASVAEIVTL